MGFPGFDVNGAEPLNVLFDSYNAILKCTTAAWSAEKSLFYQSLTAFILWFIKIVKEIRPEETECPSTPRLRDWFSLWFLELWLKENLYYFHDNIYMQLERW